MKKKLKLLWDDGIFPNKPVSKKSPILLMALHLMNKRKQFKIIDYEKVIDPLELLLTCHESLKLYEKKMGNQNAKRI